MDDGQRISESERIQIEHIMELDMEELQIEEVDEDFHSSDVDDALTSVHGDGGAGPYGGFTFDTSLASLHTYLGEFDDTHGRMAFLDGGAILNLPMFYLEGVVLFPEATLPLRVIQPRFIAAVQKAMNQVDAPNTIGVIRVYRHTDEGRLCFAATGTTAEIRQHRRLENGTLNVVARGQQRFRLKRCWIDVEGSPCAEVQIVQEDTPLRTPKSAFGRLASVSNSQNYNFSSSFPSDVFPCKQHGDEDAEIDREYLSGASTASDSPYGYDRINESLSSDEEFMQDRGLKRSSPYPAEEPSPGKISSKNEKRKGSLAVCKAAMSFWPQWVYQMYDAYSLAQKAADLWRQVIVGNPSMDDYKKKPDLLSFYIASKLPISESTRQELLDIDGISYRLQRLIQLLKGFNLICCKNCRTLIAKRSDMLVMSTNGPMNAFVNPHGFVHEVITVHGARGLALRGPPVKEHSWFPGYAWTMAYCAACETNMGWLFTAIRTDLAPGSFWGIRSSQVADDI